MWSWFIVDLELIWSWCGADEELMKSWCGADMELIWSWCWGDVELMWSWCWTDLEIDLRGYMLVFMFRAAVKYMQVLVPSTAAFCRAKCELPFGLVVPPGKKHTRHRSLAARPLLCRASLLAMGAPARRNLLPCLSAGRRECWQGLSACRSK